MLHGKKSHVSAALDGSSNRPMSRFGSRDIARPPLLAEATAVLLTIHKARDLGFTKLNVASDSQILIKALNGEIPHKEFHMTLHDILDLFSSFSLIFFQFRL